MLNNDLFKLPLQFFADEAEKDTEDTTGAEDTAETTKSFSQSELDAAISKAIASNKAKMQKQYEQLLEKAKADGIVKGKSYADLTEEQKREKELEDREKEIALKEKELTTRERLAGIKNDLAETGLPETYAKHLVHLETDAETKAAIAEIKKDFEEAVNAKVKESLRQDSPKAGAKAGSSKKTLAETIAEERNKQNQAQEFDPWAIKTN